MATRIIAEGSNDFGTPAAAEDVFVAGGATTISLNLNWSTVTDMDVLDVPRGFIADIGSSAAPLQTRIGTKLLYGAAAGHLWWASDGSVSDTSALVKILGGGHLHFVNVGTATRLEQSSGRFTLGTSATVTNFRMQGGIAELLDDSSTDPTLLEVLGGHCTTERGGTTFRHEGGTLVVDAAGNAIGTFDIYASGVQLLGSGTITQLNAIKGIPDLSALKSPVTITNCNCNTMLPGAFEFLSNSKITFSNAPVELFGVE